LLLHATAVTKSFSGVRALKGVSFDLRPGEVHALVGENGAGKSTLIRIMTGAVTADSGTIAVGDRVVAHLDPHAARSLGIAAIYQQPSLFPDLTVAENIALALEQGRSWRRVRWRERKRVAADVLARLGAAIGVDRPAGSLSLPEQQMVEIAKAIGADARILIMDEPTASLTDRDVERLFEVIGRLRDHGVGIIYISHRLEEIFQVADRITVLRDGETIETRDRADLDRATLIRLMVGRELSAVFPKRQVAIADVALELRGVGHRASGVRDVSLSVRSGEILGVTGLVGSGRTELAEVLFGLRPADAGEIRVRSVPVKIASPAQAIGLGLGYVPEDRRQHGVVLEMSVAANTSLANLGGVSRRGLLDWRAEQTMAARYVDDLRIKAPSVAVPVGTLSGGNQQKVALSRWLSIDPAVLILDEPTQGVDVGAKSEIHDLMGRLAERGMAILMISSEMPEILGMSDRIAVMRAGTVRAVLPRAEATQATILAAALGH
jgi:rhamnose transport system ATP-binding protein